VPALLPLTRNPDPALRLAALHILANAGGSQAVAPVAAALQDQAESVRDEAVRTLSTWPNNWPGDREVEEPLLTLARSGQKPLYQTLGLRGYLQSVQANKQLKNADKLDKINAVLPLIKRPEEKRLAIAVIGGAPGAGALELLATFAADPAVAEDSCAALVKVASASSSGIPQAERQRALKTVLDYSKNDETKKRAEQLLKAQP
jgi:HEAT repeat protein